MLSKLWCPENNRIQVCVDAYENGVPTGRFYHSTWEVQGFSSLTQLLVQIEAILDEQRLPQSYTTPRTFSAILEQREAGPSPAASPKGICATFVLKILFRQHASWQGSVVWKERQQEESFRSVLELIHLLDSALRSPEGWALLPQTTE